VGSGDVDIGGGRHVGCRLVVALAESVSAAVGGADVEAVDAQAVSPSAATTPVAAARRLYLVSS
jgi:hypothetical protein